MSDLVRRSRFLAAGQDDPHSVTISELCDEILRLRRAMGRALNATPDQTPDGEGWDRVRDVQKILCAAFRHAK